jgi:hypothetical protein
LHSKSVPSCKASKELLAGYNTSALIDHPQEKEKLQLNIDIILIIIKTVSEFSDTW